MIEDLIEKIIFEEGDSPRIYECTRGKLTIGAGINLEAQEMPEEVRNFWLRMIVEDIVQELNRRLYLSNNIACTNNRQVFIVLVDMAYQMGLDGLFKFTKMLAALKTKNYKLGAKELLASNYATQTPNRARRNADILLNIN